MRYYAHTGNEPDKSDWQTLKDHLLAVAEMASAMAELLGLGQAAYMAGLFHDLGKYTLAFLARLEGSTNPVDHSTAGAALLLERTTGPDKWMAELLAYCIAGHHAGLPDRRNEFSHCLHHRLKEFSNRPDPVWEDELAPNFTGLSTDVLLNAMRQPYPAFVLSVLTRMLFSCLVDADRKDTERYAEALKGREPDRKWKSLQELLPDFLDRFDRHMAGMPKDSELSPLRREILDHARSQAALEPGLFTLTVPTGGGKTLTSLGFALDHAKAYGHTRIIYAIPFTSIIEQTADIFRKILDFGGEEHVLEHHSAIDEEEFDSKNARERGDKLKLAMEDWSAPIVVTTNVQFFESLFAARPSRARKLHNIAGSIIILDEAQTIPRHLLVPCARTLDALARICRCTIVLCTATQPALDADNFEKGHPVGLPLAGRELAPDPQGLARRLRRAHIRFTGEMTNGDLIEALSGEQQALVIVNSRKHALELFREAQAAELSGLVHLTTRQYAVDRRHIIADVKKQLKDNLPVRVIATSLIEAGVDIDFPKVWRAEAGLDQIIQAAGRCNREGKRPVEDSIVSVFSAAGYPIPVEIKGLVEDMQRMLSRHDDLLSIEAIEDYFGEVYWRKGEEGLGKPFLDRFSVTPDGTDFAFRTVAADFRMIDSSMVPVIVAGDETARKAVADLAFENIPSGSIARRLQGYIVQTPPKARDLLIQNGYVHFVEPDLRGDQFAVLQNDSLYSHEVGLLWENGEYLTNENSII
ncbi:CRISPR-associated helicase Cas3' [Brucella sp. IR073]|uniref:CRISPR-associated helicase Cas3' n=1 Tax=unclassified Brucella TaxID=2632610 RepID=UPI003B983268